MANCIWISTSSGDFNVTGNWSTGTVPTTGDNIIFNGTGTANLTTNLDQHTVVFGSIYIDQANTAQIGTLSAAGVAVYLQHGAANVYIGQTTGGGSPSGSALILLNSGSTSCTYAIYDGGSTAAVNSFLPAIQILGTSLTINQSGGNVGLAVRQGETATAALWTMQKGSGTSVPTPSAYWGPGSTITSFKIDYGTALDRSGNSTTTGLVNGGTLNYQGTGGFGTSLGVNSQGVCYIAGTGTIVQLNLSGTFDHTRDGRTITLTNTTIYKGAKFLIDNGVASSTVRTNPPVLSGCGMQDITLSSPIGDLV